MGEREAEGLGCRICLAFMLTDLLVVCSFIFPYMTWFSALVILVSGTESLRCIRGLDNLHVLAIAYPFSQGQELLQGCLGQADPSLDVPNECQLSWVSPGHCPECPGFCVPGFMACPCHICHSVGIAPSKPGSLPACSGPRRAEFGHQLHPLPGAEMTEVSTLL